MWSESTTARPALNAIWSWESKKILPVNAQRQLLPKGDLRTGFFLSTKSSKIITKKLQKSYCKLVSKELQYGYSKGKTPRLCVKSFSSCFLGYWARILLLRLFSFTAMIHAPHRQCPASCAKGLVRCFGRAFLHSASPVLPAKVILQKSKYDQCLKTLGNLSVFPQRTIIKFGAAGVCILAGFVVKYIQSIYRQQT